MSIVSHNNSHLKKALLGLAALAGSGLFYATQIEPRWTEITTQSLILPRLHPAFDNFRIIQISDIHMETWMNGKRLSRLIERINLMHPDLVVITGDFVTHIHENTPGDLVESLSQIQAPDGVFAVLGNHDYWSDVVTVREILVASGVTELPNQVHTIRRGEAQLHIAGIDDYWERQTRLHIVLDQLPAEGAAILLAHEPDFAEISAKTGRFDLQLSGHTHGGQVIPPGYHPIVVPLYGTKYPLGLYEIEGMKLYTNRGLGTAQLPIRFNCRPEITVITLHAPFEK